MRHHEKWMRIALELANATRGQTSPNPMVGAVVVKDGRIVGSGAHLKAGTPHAEVHALNMAGEQAKGSTLYVTLEPCNHHGKTPPCTEKILSSGCKRVVLGARDPDKRVSGTGVSRLREAGVEVIEGVLEEECLRLNEAYFHHRRTGLPFVTMKTAMTLDGKIATSTGDSKWVTNELSREHVHYMRHWHDAIMVGIGTVLKDSPRLTTRLPEGGKNPLRIVADSRLRIPLDIPLTDAREAPTWIFCTAEADKEKEKRLVERGVKVIRTGDGPRVDLLKAMRHLGDQGILSLLLEGGGELNWSMLEASLVGKVVTFIAPKLLGGRESITPVSGRGFEKMSFAVELENITVERFGGDLCITGYPKYSKEDKTQ